MMTTLFYQLRAAAGLSQTAAASFLRVRVNKVKAFDTGRSSPPEGIITELAVLVRQITVTADAMIDLYDDEVEKRGEEPASVEIGLVSDDYEAATLGFSSAAAHHRSCTIYAATLIAEGVRVDMVPRGTTSNTALASDLNDILRDVAGLPTTPGDNSD